MPPAQTRNKRSVDVDELLGPRGVQALYNAILADDSYRSVRTPEEFIRRTLVHFLNWSKELHGSLSPAYVATRMNKVLPRVKLLRVVRRCRLPGGDADADASAIFGRRPQGDVAPALSEDGPSPLQLLSDSSSSDSDDLHL